MPHVSGRPCVAGARTMTAPKLAPQQTSRPNFNHEYLNNHWVYAFHVLPRAWPTGLFHPISISTGFNTGNPITSTPCYFNHAYPLSSSLSLFFCGRFQSRLLHVVGDLRIVILLYYYFVLSFYPLSQHFLTNLLTLHLNFQLLMQLDYSLGLRNHALLNRFNYTW